MKRSLPRLVAGLLLLVAASVSGAEDDDDKPLKTSESEALSSPTTPAASPKPAGSWKPIPTSSDRVLYGLAANGHLLTVPGWMLDPFLKTHTELVSGGFGLSFFRRKGTFDVVLTLDVGVYTPPDGNYLGAANSPALDTHYTQFRNLNFISLDVSFYWHHDLTSWLALVIGGGIGIGFVTGDIFVINSGGVQSATMTTICNSANVRDPEKCFPISTDTYTTTMGTTATIGNIRPSDPDFQRKLDATAAAQDACNRANTDGTRDCRDTSAHPYYHKSSDKPPVLPVINFQIGFKLKLHRHLNFNISGGFRTGWVFGGGPEVVF